MMYHLNNKNKRTNLALSFTARVPPCKRRVTFWPHPRHSEFLFLFFCILELEIWALVEWPIRWAHFSRFYLGLSLHWVNLNLPQIPWLSESSFKLILYHIMIIMSRIVSAKRYSSQIFRGGKKKIHLKKWSQT